MPFKMTAAVFIRQNNQGGFCLWESMATLMPMVDEFIVMDCGSTDGTLETLKSLASQNKKIRLEHGKMEGDATQFAVLANDLVSMAKNDRVLYYQADEIWHKNLLGLMREALDGKDIGPHGLSFWRYQLCENLQRCKWFPHLVHRVGIKGNFHFNTDPEKKGLNSDGMNSTTVNDAKICSNFDGGWFIKWGEVYKEYPTLLPTHEMILDVSSVGAFLGNIRRKRALHAPHWNESAEQINIGGTFYDLAKWMQDQDYNMNWHRRESPFQIPDVMKYHLGEPVYKVREDLLVQIAQG